MYELVKRLRDRATRENDYFAHGGDIINEAADAIEELSRAQEQWIGQERNALLKSIPRWIPVTEQLPELGVRALCKCRANIYEVLTWTADGWEHDPQLCTKASPASLGIYKSGLAERGGDGKRQLNNI